MSLTLPDADPTVDPTGAADDSAVLETMARAMLHRWPADEPITSGDLDQAARALAALRATHDPETYLADSRTALITSLMRSMGCTMADDVGECPNCDTGTCRPHGTIWTCDVHDWHEDGNTEHVCGYAAMLAANLPVTTRPDIDTKTGPADGTSGRIDPDIRARIQRILRHATHGTLTRDYQAEAATLLRTIS